MNNIEYAKNLLLEGKLVAIPTETVYGLGADASNPTALKKIYIAKGRPTTNPLIIHIPNVDAMSDWATAIPDSAWQLAKTFWPGPLTLVLKKHPRVSKIVTGGQDTVALRIPNHPLSLELLSQFQGGIAAPSANRSGKISPTTASHVRSELGDAVDYILDGGPCTVGIESTIVALVNPTPTILRQGSIDSFALKEILGGDVFQREESSSTISVPGSELSHYAPSQPLYLLETTLMLQKMQELASKKISFSVISFLEAPSASAPSVSKWIVAARDPILYARQLYAHLHTLDKLNTKCILVEEPPKNNGWLAIRDRLQRAAHLAK